MAQELYPRKKLKQVYKNMPLDSYQQLRTGEHYVQRRQYIPIFTIHTERTSFTDGHEGYLQEHVTICNRITAFDLNWHG